MTDTFQQVIDALYVISINAKHARGDAIQMVKSDEECDIDKVRDLYTFVRTVVIASQQLEERLKRAIDHLEKDEDPWEEPLS